MKTLIVDNYDSFSFNLAQYIAEVNGEEPFVVKNDAYSLEDLLALPFDNVLISPGPGHPAVPGDFGVSAALIRQDDVPLLGVCLGFQGIGLAHGHEVVLAPQPFHGRTSLVHHSGSGLFANIPSPCEVARYHSLCIQKPLRSPLVPIASTEDGILMGLQHISRPLWGVQFHPESIATEFGMVLLRNFRDLSHAWLSKARPRVFVSRSELVDPTASKAHEANRPDHELKQAAAAPNSQVLWTSWASDVSAETAFVRLFGQKDTAFWLDSSRVIPGLSRFSFMGDLSHRGAQHLQYELAKKELTIRDQGGTTSLHLESIFDYLRDRLEVDSLPACDDLPFDFHGGFVGYLGYELKAECDGEAVHASDTPDANFLYVKRFLCFDHEEGKLFAVAVVDAGEDESEIRAWLSDMRRRIEAICQEDEAVLSQYSARPPLFSLEKAKDAYLEAIDRSQEELRNGESYEVCLTNRIRTRAFVHPLSLYRTLRRSNPAPYAAFLQFPNMSVACSSPERFLKVDRARVVEAKPIKGTARRNLADDLVDAGIAESLRTSEKNRSENLMIVDLMRNDLGRVCQTGSVKVPRLMAIESYATVHQMVSTIQGTLRTDNGVIDCIRAAFPGGSMTGAPKKRTMEIIDRLEDSARGVYSGAIGFLSLNGTADLNIVIRTAVIQGRNVSIGVGGAIVSLSSAEEEFDETMLKGEVLMRAIAEHVAGPGASFSEPKANAVPQDSVCETVAATERAMLHAYDGDRLVTQLHDGTEATA